MTRRTSQQRRLGCLCNRLFVAAICSRDAGLSFRVSELWGTEPELYLNGDLTAAQYVDLRIRFCSIVGS
jgi:hypothetical protein